MATDFVITWVDGADPDWKKARAAYLPGEQEMENGKRKSRYRDWNFLPYWFRGVERFAPWVHHIYFVTWGHVPEWLNTSHPKLTVVKHEDYIPREYLPTFNSHVIEWNLHRIEGLSEQFVYFNDDMLFLRPVKETRFFKNGKPCDMLALQPVVANRSDPVMPYIYLNNAMVLAGYFSKRENIKKQPQAYFHVGYPPKYFLYNMLETAFPQTTGYYTVHGASPFLKQTYTELWEKEGELLDQVCRHRFRSPEDVSQYLLREWQKLKGEFIPENTHDFCRYFNVQDHNERLLRTIRKQKAPMICINDAETLTDFAGAKRDLLLAWDSILPEKSAFEK